MMRPASWTSVKNSEPSWSADMTCSTSSSSNATSRARAVKPASRIAASYRVVVRG